MQSEVRLVQPSMDYREQYLQFYEDWRRSGEDMVPWVIEKEPEHFQAMVDFLYSQDSEEKVSYGEWVPHSTYWLLDSRNTVLGAVNIRHRLNQHLYNCGGHIGYGVCPSERRKGYATLILSFALEKTRELGLKKVLVVCDQGNTASERTIIKNGGVFDSEYIEENGNVVRRFWIDL
jgi:predicted acetyltransferase